jgi:hypothetical protein
MYLHNNVQKSVMVDNWAHQLIQQFLLQMTHKMIVQGVAHLVLNNVHVPQSHTCLTHVIRNYY